MSERDYAGWLIKKYGAYYRPNWSGYTDNAAQAGRYTRAQAEAEAEMPKETCNFAIVPAPECAPEEFVTVVLVTARWKPGTPPRGSK